MTTAISNSLAWLLLLAAGILEVVWSLTMKASEGFSKPHYTTVTVAAAVLSFWLLGLSLRALPVGTAYAVWTGIGAAGAMVLGILIFKEPASAARIGCVLLILIGVLGLRLTSSK